MISLLRNYILNQRRFFVQEVTTFTQISTYCICGNIKRFKPCLQVKHFSDKCNETTEKNLIYVGPLTRKVRNIKIFSLLSTLVSIGFQPFLYMKLVEEDNLANAGTIFALFNIMTISSPLLVHLLAKRYVIELYHHPKEEEYSAKIFTFFCKQKEITFTKNDVIEPTTPRTGMFTTCIAKGYPLLLDEDQFLEPKHFNIMMKYNEPIDFEIEKLNVTALNRPPTENKNVMIEDKNVKQK